MNNEIKFRYAFQSIDGRKFVEYFYLTEIEHGKLVDYLAGLHDVKVIQKNIYSGMLDKNNIPIYDGDIVHINWLEYIPNEELIKEVQNNHEKGTVYDSWNEYFDAQEACKELKIVELVTPIIFENGMFQGVREEDQRILFYHKIKEWDVEIIGNIYENPELLHTGVRN